MKLISRLRGHRFCAFCKTQRRIYVKKHVDLTNVLLSIIFAAVTAFIFWGQPDGQVLILFCLFISSAEVFVYLRWRMAIVCSLCGFDPLIYKRSPEKAAKRVNSFFKEHAESPQFWLTRSPLLETQKRIRAHEKKAARRESMAQKAKSSALDRAKTV